jgi:hypothetical protein
MVTTRSGRSTPTKDAGLRQRKPAAAAVTSTTKKTSGSALPDTNDFHVMRKFFHVFGAMNAVVYWYLLR